jgi:hypothetical protein
MKKEKIKQLMDVMQAYVNGKTIQYYKVDLSFKIEHPGEPNFNNKWVDVDEEHLFRPDLYDYRIKPEPRNRSFKNAEECWQEMLKHQPFGWIKSKTDGHYSMVTVVYDAEDMRSLAISGNHIWSLDETMSDYTFADGAPFGIVIKEK